MTGARLVVISVTAQTHTLTYAAGFNGAGAGADVGTYGGAIADGIVLTAIDGVWFVEPGGNTNVTLG